jgi:hypothetical protein
MRIVSDVIISRTHKILQIRIANNFGGGYKTSLSWSKAEFTIISVFFSANVKERLSERCYSEWKGT